MYKKTSFPLRNPTERARSHNDDVMREHPLFVDPVGKDPRNHIRFEDDRPKGITREGVTTIDGIGLRRWRLTEDRLETIAHIKSRLDFLKLAARYPDDARTQEKVKGACQYIESAKKPEAEFSSMVIDYLVNLGE